jgi:hypothetical protein
MVLEGDDWALSSQQGTLTITQYLIFCHYRKLPFAEPGKIKYDTLKIERNTARKHRLNLNRPDINCIIIEHVYIQ